MILNIWVIKLKKSNKIKNIIVILLFITIIIIGIYSNITEKNTNKNTVTNTIISYDISNIPDYTEEIYVQINNNIPQFTEDDFNIEEDYYSELKNGRVRNGNDKN